MTLTAPRRGATAVGGPRRPGDVLRGVARVTGELLLTAGVVVLLFVAWQLWGTSRATSQAQDSLGAQLDQQWARERPSPTPGTGPAPAPAAGATRPGPPIAAPAEGEPLLHLRIPAIGVDWVVVQGVELPDIAKGPGHYPASAMPGQVGNFAVAGHRTTHGAPFNRVAELHAGDLVVAEVVDRVYTYRVTSTEIVRPGQVEVVAPVPGRPGVRPTERLVTLTSCNPKYSARERYVVHGQLASVKAR